MRLMILEDKRLLRTVPAESNVVSIGSSPDCYVHLPDPRVGSHQASIAADQNGIWWLEVLDTTLPTSLNRAIQKGRAQLRHADEIEMGPFAIRLFMETDKSREELRHERMAALTQIHGQTLPLCTISHSFDHPVTLSKEHIEQFTLLTSRLAQMDDVRELIPPILRAALRTVNGHRAWIGVRKPDVDGFEWSLGSHEDGTPCDRPEFCAITLPRCLTYSQYLCIPDVPVVGARSALAVPLACSSGVRGVLYVENADGSLPFDEEALNTMSALASAVALPVDNVVRRVVAKRQAVAAKEEMLARATQDAVTPKSLPEWDDLLFAAYREMGSKRCCDVYDIVQLPNKTAYFVLARIQADNTAMPRLFAEVRAAFRSAALHMDGPHQFAMALNWLVASSKAKAAVDIAIVWIDPANNRVQFCLAAEGICMGKIHADGACEQLSTTDQPPIGRDRAANYVAHTISLNSGETLFVATAGADHAMNAEGEAFGTANLMENLCDGLGDTPSHVLSELATDVRDFTENGECAEDITVLLAQRQ